MFNGPISRQQATLTTTTVLNRTTETLDALASGHSQTTETTAPLPRDRAVDGRNMRDGAAGHHGAEKLEEAFSVAGEGAKLGVKGGKGAGYVNASISELSHAGHGLEHAEGIAEKVVAGAAAVKLAVTVGEAVLAECQGYAGRQAEKELPGLFSKVGEAGEDGKIAESLNAMNKGRQAANAQTRVKTVLEGAHSYHEAAHGLGGSHSAAAHVGAVDGGAAHAGGAVAGAVAKKLLGPAFQIALGCVKYSSAKKQEAAHQDRLNKLEQGVRVPENASAKRRAIGHDFESIRAAAVEAKESRDKHLAKAKSDAKTQIGLGVAGAVLAVAPLVVAAPVVLPIIGIALGAATLAAVVRNVVHSVESKRSENKIKLALKEAVATKGSMTEDQKDSLLTQIKSKDRVRDKARIEKFNGAAAAIASMIDSLVDKSASHRGHGFGLAPLELKAKVVSIISSDKILKNGTDAHVKQLLNNLNRENLEATKQELLGFWATAAI